MRHRQSLYGPGRWQQERERMHLPDTARAPIPDRTVPVSDVLPGVMRELGLEAKRWEQVIETEWSTLVGAQVARCARPGGVNRQTLSIYVNSSVWLHELSRFSQPRILAKLQERFGATRIKQVRLELDPDLNRNRR